jgi:hypothetical protein
VRLEYAKRLYFVIGYTCRNCNRNEKVYAVAGKPKGAGEGVVMKLGESPPFGSPLASRVISLIGPERELFLKGRRVENQGLGIGAFAYYRRVVENQKNRIVTEIKRVAEKAGASDEMLQSFDRALQATQFSKAVEEVKNSIPQSLLIMGHNPLTLLHKALSAGLHGESDEDCLEAASSIRIVLTELADMMGQILKDEAELRNAVKRLLNPGYGDEK